MKRTLLIGVAALTAGLAGCNRERAEMRADPVVAAEIRQELTDARVPGTIQVAMTNGTATLTGIVPDAAAKSKAEDVAGDVDGVHRVVNNLRTTSAADAPMPGAGAPPPSPPPGHVPPSPPSEMR